MVPADFHAFQAFHLSRVLPFTEIGLSVLIHLFGSIHRYSFFPLAKQLVFYFVFFLQNTTSVASLTTNPFDFSDALFPPIGLVTRAYVN